MTQPLSAVVVGGSAGVGRALAGELAGRGYDLVIAARRERDLGAVAADLRARHGVEVTPLTIDLTAEDASVGAWFECCTAVMPNPDVVAIPAGSVDDSDDGLASWDRSQALLRGNGLAVIQLAAEFLGGFEARGRGTLVLFSSIAAAAPRRRNVAYAAAKAALESWARSMQHRLAGTDVTVQVYALGYVDTTLSRGEALRLPAVSPERVARHVVGNLSRGRRFEYYPRYWALITTALRLLPFSAYRRLRF